MLCCVISTVTGLAIAIILLLSSLNAYQSKHWLQGMSKVVRLLAADVIGVLAWYFVRKSKLLLGWGTTIFYIVLSLLLIELVGIHPAIVIIVLILYALLFKTKEEREKSERQESGS